MKHRIAPLRIVAILLAAGSVVDVSAESFVYCSNRGEPTTLDPHKAPNGWETTIDLELFMGLISGSADAKVLPGMAERWSADDDGLGFTFHLRDGLTWSDGAPLTAEDFVWSFRRMLDSATASPYASLHYPIVNARDVNIGAMPPSVLGVNAPDPRTVSIRLSRPAPYYP